MTNNKKPNEKRPADNPPGTFHYNPGNMAGKTPRGRKAQAIQEQNAGKVDDQRKPDSSRRPK